MRLCAVLCALALASHAQTLERAEALWRAHRYQEANGAFTALVKANPKNPDFKVRWGRLFLERFNSADAASLFQEALQIKKDHAGALLGLALVAADGFENKAVELAQAALEADPKLIEARELLARLALEDGDSNKAVEEADKALAISPNAMQALAIRATIDWMDDKAETPWIQKVLERDPQYGEAYETAGHFFVLNRRYEEGIRFYRKAIELKPDLWSARSQLGINLMRFGQEAEARKHLEECYENSYRNEATVNTLRLMDSYKNFITYKTPTTILKLHKKEAELLRPYFEAEMTRALQTYQKKYQITLPGPVQVEAYPDHEDFAVRTMGMPGLGALGVTFGDVIAMDSPSGRRPGSFHWASTLWHELSHVYVLTATKHRVPRWFTEGMAVHEENAISPDWGDRLDSQVMNAIKKKKLVPVSELDRTFVRPTYPGQVIVSYFQAGRICDYINQQWGYSKLLDMMRAFARLETTPQVIREQLGIEPEEFDRRFLGALETETKRAVDGFDEWKKRLKQVAEFAKAKRYDDVIREGTEIRNIYPDYVEAGSVYEFLADAYTAKNDKTSAMAELERYSKIGGRYPPLLKRLATLLEEAGRKKDAAAVLSRLIFIHPVDEELHRRLGDLWMAQGDLPGAIREYQAVIAMKPLDAAASHYNLAKAYQGARESERAKEELLLALEAAPGYRPAQKLLLELSR